MKVKINRFLKFFCFFLELFFKTEFFVERRLHVDQHGVLTEAGDFSPRDHDVLAFSETERTAIEKHGDGGNTPGADVNDGIVDITEPLSVADVDDLLVL